MNALQQQPFSTSEGILAFCLSQAGCEFLDPSRPCVHIYSPETLIAAGYRGENLWDSAIDAWKKNVRGHVEFSFVLTKRLQELCKIYRELKKVLEDEEAEDVRADVMIKDVAERIACGAMLVDEGILRITCINTKVRSEFMNLWKQMVPILKIPEKGLVRRYDTTVSVNTTRGPKVLEAHAVKRPGYKMISLNASEALKKKLGL